MKDGVCENIDECTAGTHDCAHVCNDNAPASATNVFFTCACNHRYKLGADGKACDDIDDCDDTQTDLAHEYVAHATCTNTIGSHDCTCDQYWNADGSEARTEYLNNDEFADDITLCVGSDVPQNLYGECTNGSYECACMTGFTFEGDVCVDIDECATGDRVCQPSAVCGTDEQ